MLFRGRDLRGRTPPLTAASATRAGSGSAGAVLEGGILGKGGQLPLPLASSSEEQLPLLEVEESCSEVRDVRRKALVELYNPMQKIAGVSVEIF